MNQDFNPPYPMEQNKHHEHVFSFGLNHQIVSSLSSDRTQDHAAFYHPQLFQPHHHPQAEYYGYGGGSSHERENKIEVKKVGVKLKMKESSSLSSNSTTSSYNCNTSTIRVCSDCQTTKTPLWRSGPKGPKSLCNACGIRQRKARRAIAAAKTGNGGGVASDPPMKKRYKLGGGSSTSSGKKMGFEDFLINLSNKLAFHGVFPQDEKEAAILLMALSSGLVHG